jgi:hypothetical protein
VKLRVLRYPRLNKDGGGTRVNPRREPIDHRVPGVLLNVVGVFVVRGEGMPISDEEEALVLVLETHPIFQHPMIVPKV